MARLRYNGLTAELGADLLTADTTVTFSEALTSAAGAVPTITGSDYIPLVVLGATGGAREIIHLTAYTTGATTGTVTRAQESTTAADHDAGLTVVNGMTVADATEFAATASGDTAWTLVGTFTNSWVNYGGGVQEAQYIKDAAGLVHLRGTIKSGTVGSAAFTLPSGYRPATGRYDMLVNSNNALGQLFISTTGAVTPLAPSTNTFVRLDGVSFPAGL